MQDKEGKSHIKSTFRLSQSHHIVLGFLLGVVPFEPAAHAAYSEPSATRWFQMCLYPRFELAQYFRAVL